MNRFRQGGRCSNDRRNAKSAASPRPSTEGRVAGIQVRIAIAAAVVVFNDVFEDGEASEPVPIVSCDSGFAQQSGQQTGGNILMMRIRYAKPDRCFDHELMLCSGVWAFKSEPSQVKNQVLAFNRA